MGLWGLSEVVISGSGCKIHYNKYVGMITIEIGSRIGNGQCSKGRDCF